jgi:hypothetical protein
MSQTSSGASANVRNGKQHVGTIHSVKGREYECVIAVIDGYRDTEDDKRRCSNVVYVAITRHRTRLIIVQNNSKTTKAYSRFIETFSQWTPDFVVHHGVPTKLIEPTGATDLTSISVTEIIKYMSPAFMKSLTDEYVTDSVVVEAQTPIQYRSEVQCSDCVEQVSALYGIGVPMLFEIGETTHSAAFDISVSAHICRNSEEKNQFLVANTGKPAFLRKEYNLLFPISMRGRVLKSYKIVKETPLAEHGQHLMLVANALNAFSGAHHLLKQISSYAWVENDVLDAGVKRLQAKFMNEGVEEFERAYGVIAGAGAGAYRLKIQGAVDVVTAKADAVTLWELKFKDSTDRDDVIQLAMYVAMCKLKQYSPSRVDGRLYNVRTEEDRLLSVKRPADFLCAIACYYKQQEQEKQSDVEFVTSIQCVRDALPPVPEIVHTVSSGCSTRTIDSFFLPVSVGNSTGDVFFTSTDDLDFMDYDYDI